MAVNLDTPVMRFPDHPLRVFQTLDGAVNEMIAESVKLKRRFPNLTDDRIIEILLELKRLSGPRKVE